MRIWFDVLSPKQVLFFESMIRRAGAEHQILFTSRGYREVTDLCRIRKLSPTQVGSHGGGGKSQKLAASLERAALLMDLVTKFGPDAAVSSCSPEASRISFGLGIPHIGFSNSPHAEAVCRLSVPLLTRLLIPGHIPKEAFSRYGLEPDRIVPYDALDEFLIVRNGSASAEDARPTGLQPDRKTILFRTYETQAAYVDRHTDMNPILDAILDEFPECNVVVSARYSEQVEAFRDSYGDRAIILDSVFDSGALLEWCDILVGSGGTMTKEAVLRGIPAVSYDAVPNVDERYLVGAGVLQRAREPGKIASSVRLMLQQGRAPFQERARRLLSSMEDPYDTLLAQLDACYR